MDTYQKRAALARDYSLAVTGMDIWTGVCGGLASFEGALYAGKDLFQPQMAVESNGKRPAEIRLRQAVGGALADAGLNQGGAIGIIVVPEEPAEPLSISVRRARPLAAIFGLSGPVEDIDVDSAAVFDRAAQMLDDVQLQAVVVGWISHELQSAASIVIRRKMEAAALDERIYTGINPVRESQLPHEIGYLEIASSRSSRNIGEIFEPYKNPQSEMTIALGGESIPFIPAVVKTALCLYHRYLPASSHLQSQGSDYWLENLPFYVVKESRTWFQPELAEGRKAAILSADSYLVFSEERSIRIRSNSALHTADLNLFPVIGSSLEELQAGLAALQADVSGSDDLKGVAQRAIENYTQYPEALYTVSVMGRTREEVNREIDYAIKGAASAFEKGADWQTPLGSTFSPTPVGSDGHVAFVYPGAFNSYVGMGRELFRLFPHLHERFAAVSSDIGSVICEDLLYPRSRSPIDEDILNRAEYLLNDDPIAMLKSGTTLSTLYTMILRDVFCIEPAAAFGYSLGENSMMFAMGVWKNGDETSRRLSKSELFRTRLSGPQNAIREYWGGASPDHDQALWRNYLIMASPERVYAAMKGEANVYLTHINTPRQVVIGGDPAACQRVIQSLHCAHLQAPFNHALHNDAMRSEQALLTDLHNSPVVSIPQTRLYSAAGYQPLEVNRRQIAEGLGHMLCSCLDFPRLIDEVYAGGARIFIELGAGSNCAKWVDETLKGKPHTAISINRRGVDDLTSIVRVLAKLCTHRSRFDLSALYQEPECSDLITRMKIPANSVYEV